MVALKLRKQWLPFSGMVALKVRTGGSIGAGIIILDNYRQYFIEQLKITPQMNNTLLYKRLKDDFGDEVEVPVSTFHRYIKNLREQTGYVKPQRKTGLRDDPEPGYEAQVDYV